MAVSNDNPPSNPEGLNPADAAARIAEGNRLNSDARNRAFNEGSDARIYGIPHCNNPYFGVLEDGLRTLWSQGWQHVNKYWGIDACPRDRVHKLPPVHNNAA